MPPPAFLNALAEYSMKRVNLFNSFKAWADFFKILSFTEV
jgi:hypothetical protein